MFLSFLGKNQGANIDPPPPSVIVSICPTPLPPFVSDVSIWLTPLPPCVSDCQHFPNPPPPPRPLT
jgi:hypothetical protein